MLTAHKETGNKETGELGNIFIVAILKETGEITGNIFIVDILKETGVITGEHFHCWHSQRNRGDHW